MKTIKQFILGSIIILSYFNADAQLSGTYTIDTTGSGNFLSFTEAVDSLISQGVSGPVVIQANDGTYNEQIVIPQITGASATNTITFQSTSMDSSLVILTFNATFGNNYIVYLNGADYITFQHITLKAQNVALQRVVVYDNNANNNTFSNNSFEGITYTGNYGSDRSLIVSDNTTNDTNNTFTNNIFLNGRGGIDIVGVSDSSLEETLTISNNQFINQLQYGINLKYVGHPLINANIFQSNSTTGGYIGISINYAATPVIITKNKIDVPIASVGIILYFNLNTTGIQSVIANNMISLGGTTESKGLYLSVCRNIQVGFNSVLNYSTNLNSKAVYLQSNNNNMSLSNNIFANIGGGYAFYASQPVGNVTSSDYNDFYTTGAVLMHMGVDYATLSAYQTASGFDMNSFNVDPSFISQSDLHTSNPTLNNNGVPAYGVTDDIDGDIRNATTPDIGADEFTPITLDASISTFNAPIAPICSVTNNVEIKLLNAGFDTINNVTINWEANGILQTPYNYTGSLSSGLDTNLVIGSYTFSNNLVTNFKIWVSSPNGLSDQNNSNDTLVSNNLLYPALNGTYTIGGTSPNYATITDAVNDLNAYGICGNVIYNIRTGTYNEQISIAQIAGTSATDSVIFQSETGINTDVVIYYNNSTLNNNYIFEFKGADYVTMKNLTLGETTPTFSNFGTIFYLNNNAQYINILNNILNGRVVTTSYNVYDVIASDNTNNTNTTIKNNKINSGNIAINLKGYSFGSPGRNLTIEGNTIDNSYSGGIELNYYDSVIIASNMIMTTSNNSSYKGLKLMGVLYKSSVYNNKIYGSVGSYGMFLLYCVGTQTRPFYVYNNMVQIGGTNLTYGIYNFQGSRMVISYNSINVNSTDTTSVAFSIQGTNGGTQTYQNNIFANTGGGYAFYTPNTSLISGSNYNNLYTTGSILANNGISDLTNLTMWTDSTGLDANSISVDPLFFSPSDLHVCQALLDSAGTVNINFTTDIDNEVRNTIAPDIGADEFSQNKTSTSTTICNGDNFLLPGGTYVNTTGVYIDTFTAANGCDSIIETTLTVNTVDTSVTQTGNTITSNATTATYQWLDCNNSYAIISGETAQNYVVTTNGNYAVEVTQNGCVDTSACVNVIVTGINSEINNSQIQVYPNPTNGVLNIKFTTKFIGFVEILNLSGKIILDKPINNNSFIKLNVQNIAKGMYVLRLTNVNINQQYKLVIN